MIAVVNVNVNYLNVFSDNVLANVEALARNEGDFDGTFPACQNGEGWKEYGYIPKCDGGVCKKKHLGTKGNFGRELLSIIIKTMASLNCTLQLSEAILFK